MWIHKPVRALTPTQERPSIPEVPQGPGITLDVGPFGGGFPS